MSLNRGKIKVMTFGLGGNLGHGISQDGGHTFTTSWYLSPEELQKYIIPEHYHPEDMEGCYLIDYRELMEVKPSLAFKAPLCNPMLGEKQIDRLFQRIDLNDPLNIALLKTFAASGWGAMVASGFVGGLDYLSVDLFVDYWREQGARIGKVINGAVTWD